MSAPNAMDAAQREYYRLAMPVKSPLYDSDFFAGAGSKLNS